MANIQRLKELRDYLVAHPEQHRQKHWAAKPTVQGSCGTTLCMAGNAVLLAGLEIDWDQAAMQGHTEFVGPVPYLIASRVTNGQWIEEAAADWLELDPDEANTLFMTMDEGPALELLDELIELGYLDI